MKDDVEYHSGCKAARDRVNARASTTADRRKVAAEILDTHDFDTTDEFYLGYKEQLAQWSNRLCRHCRAVFEVPNRWRCCPRCLDVEYRDGEGFTIEDTTQTIDLGDGLELQTLIDSAGEPFLWVYDKSRSDESCNPPPMPAHEHLGKLPTETRWKVLRSRCGRLTRSGKPCRIVGPCRYHR